MTDIEIARSVKPKKIVTVAKELGLSQSDLVMFGEYKAKICYEKFAKSKMKGRLILVTSMSPTTEGNGKTTVLIGLADALRRRKLSATAVLREPSLGPVFGMKGGATGGGRSQVIPMEDINLHFNGDMHAVTSANNLLSAMIDNHIFFGNELNIDPKRILHKRCIDQNDRALRGGFVITAASEVMSILCLSRDLADLKERLGNILVAYSKEEKPIYARSLKAENAMAILLKDALMPNLVQTLEGTPSILHGGPFGNIALGCNSLIATKLGLALSDYVVTEAGFGSDLGAEKFLNIKCRLGGIAPSCAVVVATVAALKLHGGGDKDNVTKPDEVSVRRGLDNLFKHVDNLQNDFRVPVVVALNRGRHDTKTEIDLIVKKAHEKGIVVSLTECFARGSAGAEDLADKVLEMSKNESELKFSYELKQNILDKIEAVSKKVYGAKGVKLSDKAASDIIELEKLGLSGLPVVIAKTQYSLSHDARLIGRPLNFKIQVQSVEARTGAGFLVVVCGDILLMPGLPKTPNACNMRIDGNGIIEGLF